MSDPHSAAEAHVTPRRRSEAVSTAPTLRKARAATIRVDPALPDLSRTSAVAVFGYRRLPLLRRGAREIKLISVRAPDIRSLLEVVEAEQERTARQIASLETIVAAIVEGSELISTDDEHDPEGATIAYERAQASALLRQARADHDALVVTRQQLELGHQMACAVCGRDIDFERVAALPTTSRCVRCAA